MAGDVGGESAGGRLSRDPPRRPVSRGAWRQHGHGDTGRTRGRGRRLQRLHREAGWLLRVQYIYIT